MRTAAVTDLKNRLSHYLRLVRRGETVTVVDRGRPVAQITPVATPGDALARLASEGVVRLPLAPVGEDFWRRPLPRSSASVTAALLEERVDRLR